MASQRLKRVVTLSSNIVQRLRYLPSLGNSASLYRQRNTCSSLPVRQIVCSSFHTNSFLYNKSSLINIQDEDDFKKRVMESEIPVVVDFHAGWCGPCKLLGPRLETLIGAQNKENSKVILAKVDIDEMPDIAMEYGVEAIPTVIAMKNGKVADKFVGLKEDDEIETFIAKLL